MPIDRRRCLVGIGLQSIFVRRGIGSGPAFAAPTAGAQPRSRINAGAPTTTRSWHVDNNMAANGDGVTWETAWNAFANIRWESIAPGDTIYISGGHSGQIYNETLTIRAGGAPGAQITITAGVDAAHAGTVTIDAQSVRSQCIAVGNHNYLTIRDLTIQNTADDANLTITGAAAGVLIQRVISHSGMGSGGGKSCRCFDIRDCIADTRTLAVTLEECTATTPDLTTSQTDALWTSGNRGVLVQRNSFTVANMDPTGHSDCIQSYADIRVIYRGNRLIHPNGGENNHGFIVSDVQAGGTVYFYNNVVIMGSRPGAATGKPEIAILRELLTVGHTGTVKVWNNTIYGGLSGYDTYSTAGPMPPDEFKNNIIYALPVSIAPYCLDSGNLNRPSHTDYNNVFAFTGRLTIFGNGAGIGAARSTTSRSSGRAYFEIQLGMVMTSDMTMVGIANASERLNVFTKASKNSIAWKWGSGDISPCGDPASTCRVEAAAADVVAFALDLDKRRFWIRNLTTGSRWNADACTEQNPATDEGGYPFGILAPGPYFIMIWVGSAGDYIVLNPGRSAFVGAVPLGYSAWDAASTLNPADIGGAATLVAPVARINGVGYVDWAQWRSLGYDRHGVNANPMFIDAAAEDFRLSRHSPAAAAGMPLPFVTTDYAGNPRARKRRYDIGAYTAPI